jgi:hypothetical protein
VLGRGFWVGVEPEERWVAPMVEAGKVGTVVWDFAGGEAGAAVTQALL